MQGQRLATVCNGARVMMTAAEGPTIDPEAGPEEIGEAPKGFSPPTLNADTPAPIFGGSTGGLLRKAQVEEFYVITWESPKEQIFEMPLGRLPKIRLSGISSLYTCLRMSNHVLGPSACHPFRCAV